MKSVNQVSYAAADPRRRCDLKLACVAGLAPVGLLAFPE